MDAGHLRIGQVRHIPDVGLGVVVEALLVELVVDDEVGVILGQPALVGVGRARVGVARQQHRRALVGHVDDGERVLVGGEADLFAPE